MEKQRKRYKYPLKNVIQDLWNTEIGKFIACLMWCAFIILSGLAITELYTPSDDEVRSLTQEYIEIQLGDEYKLEAWDLDINNHVFGITDVVVSYIGSDSKSEKKKEVIEETISLEKIRETIDKEETKKRLEREIKNSN
ncbi:hypothetical protein CYH18_15165 [Listeria monocytogenes serotype 1/2a]|uniref:hypothetical protein n=1 Tax=Listeria marthii TaxID=529731 RepID=UPI001888D931|nr:hypothetical protein [Listeria marthii]EAF4459208.1 hypothetical protein [Listeria monocytogenes serotype 1/2a]MBF2394649.1 hypothetical protein [Listeria marthii]